MRPREVQRLCLVPPAQILLESNNLTLREGGLLTVTEGRVEVVSCVTRHSNPAPSISWLLGDRQLETAVQTNRTEEGEGGTKWRSESVLSFTFTQSDLAATLSCVVSHPAYTAGPEQVTANLDVLCEFPQSSVLPADRLLCCRQAECEDREEVRVPPGGWPGLPQSDLHHQLQPARPHHVVEAGPGRGPPVQGAAGIRPRHPGAGRGLRLCCREQRRQERGGQG